MSYSCLRGGYPGIGNIDASPLFVDISSRDYHLRAASPCIDAGDPALFDPDGSRSDMGAYPFGGGTAVGRHLSLPTITGPRPGSQVAIPILATFTDIDAVDLAFVTDTERLAPEGVFVLGHAFEGNGSVFTNVIGDTVKVSMASAGQISLDGELLVELAFRLSDLVQPGDTIPLAWVSFPLTNVGENPAQLTDGSVGTGPVYGDVSGDGTISGYDASIILKYRVGLIAQIDEVAADVTGNGSVMAKDAAEILRYAITPNYVFPIERGGVFSRVSGTSRTLTWVRDGQTWALTIDEPAGIDAGSFEMVVPSTANLDVVAEHFAVNRVGDRSRIAFARADHISNVLLSVESEAFAVNAPIAMSVVLNEGETGVASIIRPVAFALEQNLPNPFNPSTRIRFGLPAGGEVSLVIFTTTGQQIRTLVDEVVSAGTHGVAWDGRDARGRAVASGVYVMRLRSGAFVATRRATLVT